MAPALPHETARCFVAMNNRAQLLITSTLVIYYFASSFMGACRWENAGWGCRVHQSVHQPGRVHQSGSSRRC